MTCFDTICRKKYCILKSSATFPWRPGAGKSLLRRSRALFTRESFRFSNQTDSYGNKQGRDACHWSGAAPLLFQDTFWIIYSLTKHRCVFKGEKHFLTDFSAHKTSENNWARVSFAIRSTCARSRASLILHNLAFVCDKGKTQYFFPFIAPVNYTVQLLNSYITGRRGPRHYGVRLVWHARQVETVTWAMLQKKCICVICSCSRVFFFSFIQMDVFIRLTLFSPSHSLLSHYCFTARKVTVPRT